MVVVVVVVVSVEVVVLVVVVVVVLVVVIVVIVIVVVVFLVVVIVVVVVLVVVVGLQCDFLSTLTAIQFYSHRYMTIPRHWLKADETCCDGWVKFIINNRILVFVSIENLKKKRNKKILQTASGLVMYKALLSKCREDYTRLQV